MTVTKISVSLEEETLAAARIAADEAGLAAAALPPAEGLCHRVFRRERRARGRPPARDTGTSDVVNAHVVLTALRYQAAVLTSDPDDLQRLAATSKVRLRLHQV